jgi:AcrR family transcriptional regulator
MTKGAATRDRILLHAEAIASRDGLDGLTIGALAGELAMSKSGLFAHFLSKEGLQLAVLRRVVDRFNAQVLHPGLRAKPGEARLRSLLDHWVAWGRHRRGGGDILTAAAFELDDRPGLARDFLVRSQRQWLRTLATAVQIAVEHRHFRDTVDVDQFVTEAHGIVLARHVAGHLLDDAKAGARAAAALDELMARARRATRKRAA